MAQFLPTSPYLFKVPTEICKQYIRAIKTQHSKPTSAPTGYRKYGDLARAKNVSLGAILSTILHIDLTSFLCPMPN